MTQYSPVTGYQARYYVEGPGAGYVLITSTGTVGPGNVEFGGGGKMVNHGTDLGGFYATGYGLAINYGTIGSGGGDSSVYASLNGKVVNGPNGLIQADININRVGLLTNQGTVQGAVQFGSGDSPAAAGAVSNTGRLLSGVELVSGGTVSNGDAAHLGALITGPSGAVQLEGNVDAVNNLGTILSTGHAKNGFGVVTEATLAGALILNGSLKGMLASYIGGYVGVGMADKAGGGTVGNYGTIASTGVNPGSAGIILRSGGTVTNGGVYALPHANKGALIEGGYVGIGIPGGTGTVHNYAAITGADFAAISFAGAGNVDNGALAAVAAAIISGGQYGVVAKGYLSIHNYGGQIVAQNAVASARGVAMNGGGYLYNGVYVIGGGNVLGSVYGYGYGISGSTKSDTIVNLGAISERAPTGAAIALNAGGTVTNGHNQAGAQIGGIQGATGIAVAGAAGTVVNFGPITIGTGIGVLLTYGGTVTNGSVTDTLAAIAGVVPYGNAAGVKFAITFKNDTTYFHQGYLTNYGTISGHAGVFFAAGGTVINGSRLDTNATIAGYYGVNMQAISNANAVTNYGQIAGSSVNANGFGVLLTIGGLVVNGSNGVRSAGIHAMGSAVMIRHDPGTVQNYGTLATTSPTKSTVYLADGGTVTNGSDIDSTALIGTGQYGVSLGSSGTVTNFGTIAGSTAGVRLAFDGTVVNGAAGDPVETITGTMVGVDAAGAVATVSNYGTIVATAVSGKLSEPIGVYLKSGVLDNGNHATPMALIQGYCGVLVASAGGTVVNYGTIVGTGPKAISLLDPTDWLKLEGGSTITGTVAASGGELELAADSGMGTLSALGTSFTGFGVVQVDNSAQWTITGSSSVAAGTTLFMAPDGLLSVDGQLTNAGLVEEGGGIGGLNLLGSSQLVNMAGATLLFVGDANPDSSFSSVIYNDGTIAKVAGSAHGGTVIKSNIVSNGGTIEDLSGNLVLASEVSGTGLVTVAPGGGVLTFDGSVVGAGQQIMFNDPDTLDIANPASFGTGVGTDAYAGPTLEGFALGDVIELGGIAAGATMDYDLATGLMQITGGTTDATLSFQPGSFAGEKFAPVTGPNGFSFTLACFAAGTRIATRGGEVAVEALRVGDIVLTHGGGEQPVVWIGHRRIDCRRHRRPRNVWPVRVRAGAFADRVPQSDLLLSPDHAVFCEGALVPIRHLVNGETIVQEPCGEITYFHVELARHAVLLAEGMPAESYLDTGNRSAFANGGDAVALHADFAGFRWDVEGCAPLVVSGARLDAARRMVDARAARGRKKCSFLKERTKELLSI